MTTPAITVLVPVKAYHARYLREALESVLKQTSDDWRLLIVTELDSVAELRSFTADYLRDPRIKLIVNEGYKLAGALNTGMKRAQTAFTAALHGDDKLSPDAIEVLTRAIATQPQVDFFHSSRMIIDECGEPLSPVYLSRADVRLEHFGSPSPVKHLLCWRRSKALSIGGMDETLNSVGPDDFDFPWSMAEHGAVFHAIGECLYLYRDHRTSFRLTTHLPLSIHKREIRRIMRKHGVSRLATTIALHRARRSYLRQCLYRSEPERWLREKLHLRPGVPWRETYR